MQVQMKFQKITGAFALVSSVLIFVFALGFCTDLYAMSYYIDESSFMYVEGSHIYYDVQGFNHNVLLYSVISIILVAVMYIMQNTKRRKYYVTNYISSVVYSGFVIWVAAFIFKNVKVFKNQFLTTVDFEGWKEMDSWMTTSSYTESTFWFDAGKYVAVIAIVAAVLILANLTWKTIWMIKEKKALAYFGIGEETL